MTFGEKRMGRIVPYSTDCFVPTLCRHQGCWQHCSNCNWSQAGGPKLLFFVPPLRELFSSPWPALPFPFVFPLDSQEWYKPSCSQYCFPGKRSVLRKPYPCLLCRQILQLLALFYRCRVFLICVWHGSTGCRRSDPFHLSQFFRLFLQYPHFLLQGYFERWGFFSSCVNL